MICDETINLHNDEINKKRELHSSFDIDKYHYEIYDVLGVVYYDNKYVIIKNDNDKWHIVNDLTTDILNKTIRLYKRLQNYLKLFNEKDLVES